MRKTYIDIGHSHGAELFVIRQDGTIDTVDGGKWHGSDDPKIHFSEFDDLDDCPFQGRFCRGTRRASILAGLETITERQLLVAGKRIAKRYNCTVDCFHYEGHVVATV